MSNDSGAGENPSDSRRGEVAARATQDILRKIGDLAALPLDQPTAEQLRRALAAEPADRVRAALGRRLGRLASVVRAEQGPPRVLPAPRRPAGQKVPGFVEIATGGAW